MSEIKWIKITTDIFDDEKILLIESMPDADAIIVIWFKLLVLAGKTNNCGVLTINERMPYTDEMLATIFRRPLNTVRLALEVFEQFGMIETINNTITIPKWEVHQNVEGMDKVREQTRLRVAKYRERQKQLETPADDVTLLNATVTEQNKNKNKNKNIDKEKEINKEKEKRFTPPSLTEVESYAKEKGYRMDAEAFIDFYESKGWMVGKNKMKDWRASVRNWNRRKEQNNGKRADFRRSTEKHSRVAGTVSGIEGEVPCFQDGTPIRRIDDF